MSKEDPYSRSASPAMSVLEEKEPLVEPASPAEEPNPAKKARTNFRGDISRGYSAKTAPERVGPYPPEDLTQLAKAMKRLHKGSQTCHI